MRFRLPRIRSVAEYAAEPENNYRLLRLLAALMVIYGHSFILSPLPGHLDFVRRWLGFTYSGEFGVAIFFSISGFLVTGSYLNRGSFAYYLKCRVLRIVPGLLVCLLLTALLLGPIVSTLPASEYFRNGDTYRYISGNASLVKTVFFLPGVYEHLPLRAVNGSFWTLPAEFRLYILMGLFGLIGLLSNRRLYLWWMLALCAVAVFAPADMALYINKSGFRLIFLFFAFGSLLRVYGDRVPLSGYLVAAGIVSAVLLRSTSAFPLACFATLAYGVFWLAYVPNLHWFSGVGDYSYGLYIYAFPIQQTLRQYFEHIGPLELFAAASVLTLGCALLSWNLVEKPMLDLKQVKFRAKLAGLWRRNAALTGTAD